MPSCLRPCSRVARGGLPRTAPGTKAAIFTQALYTTRGKTRWVVGRCMKNDWKRIFPFDYYDCDFVRLRARIFLSID
jgi:hypothetical protein